MCKVSNQLAKDIKSCQYSLWLIYYYYATFCESNSILYVYQWTLTASFIRPSIAINIYLYTYCFSSVVVVL